MAYDERVVERVREVLADQPMVVEKKMFGGLSFILQGNMCCGVINEDLVVRVGPDGHDEALAQPPMPGPWISRAVQSKAWCM